MLEVLDQMARVVISQLAAARVPEMDEDFPFKDIILVAVTFSTENFQGAKLGLGTISVK